MLVSSIKKFLSPLCVFCRKDRDRREHWICDACTARLLPIRSPYCHRCGKPFDESDQAPAHACRDCTLDPPPYERARSLYHYDGWLREKIIAYKYSKELILESGFQELITQSVEADLREMITGLDGILPAPPDPKRGRSRGFNPALRMALALSRRARLPIYWREVHRSVATKPQMGLSVLARKANLKEVFAFTSPRAAERLREKRILLVDDVWTTGSTVRALSTFLKNEAHVAKIAVLTLARR